MNEDLRVIGKVKENGSCLELSTTPGIVSAQNILAASSTVFREEGASEASMGEVRPESDFSKWVKADRNKLRGGKWGESTI